jgi:ornithine cyclodeaminase/alanine dehydrogenase-like protein (mu-crystallin family)
VTPAQRWLVDDAWVAPGTHFACIGGGLAGSQELDPRILQRARIFTDDIRQCADDGEINIPLREGLLSLDDVAGDFGAVVAGRLEGRQSTDQITVFDSTGIALQDSATVPLEYERALEAGVGIEKKMIST